MRSDKVEGGRDKRELYDVKTFVVVKNKKIIKWCYPSIECVEEATQEGPDCNS